MVLSHESARSPGYGSLWFAAGSIFLFGAVSVPVSLPTIVAISRRWHAPTTVGEIAKATKKEPSEIVRLIDRCGYLVAVEKDSRPIGSWVVFEDGE